MKLASKLSVTIASFTVIATGAAGALVYQAVRNNPDDLIPVVIVTVGVAVAAIVAMVLILNSLIMGPIRSLSAAVSRISLGDLSQTVPVHSHDELGTLSQNFNEMTRQLGSTHRSLEAASITAEEERAQLVSSINGLRQGFILVDIKNHITLGNAAAIEIVRTAQTKIGTASKHPDHHRRDQHQLKFEELTAVLPDDLDLAGKITETLKNHRLAKFPELPLGGRFLNLYLSPVINGDEAIGCVLLLEDVTEERIMERSRDEFFSIASHELRTPLTAIRGNTAMIKQYYPKVLEDAGMNEMIGDIHESTVRLIEIVNDFLDTSRLEQNKMKLTFSVFALEQIIEKIMYEMAALSREKHVVLNFDQGELGRLPLVYADPGRITQVIYNLVGNAMKFTEKGSITINCLVEGKFVKVCVTDTGQGISPEGQQILFHKFQQSTADILTRDNTRGTGLGLYISKLLIEHMNGEIKLEHSEAGKGSTFSFTIPIATHEQTEKARTAPVAVSALTPGK